MALFGWLKKLKKKKVDDVLVDGIAEEASESILVTSNPKKYIAAEICSDGSEQQKPITISLVKGSSDSKPQSSRLSVNQQQINFERQSKKLKELKRDVLTTQYQHSARSNTSVKSSPATTTNNLYPSLDSLNLERHLSLVKEKAPKVKQEEKSIHDIPKEIPFSIEPRLLNPSQTKNKIAILKHDAQPGVQWITKMIERNLKFEYDFNRELYVTENYSHVKDFKTLRTFDDVKKCHRITNKPLERKASNDPKRDPLFQGYYQKFRCYKGQGSDLIDCD